VRIWRHSSGVVARRRIDARNHLPRLAAPALDVEGWRKQRRPPLTRAGTCSR
jgi:hypothetical protein